MRAAGGKPHGQGHDHRVRRPDVAAGFTVRVMVTPSGGVSPPAWSGTSRCVTTTTCPDTGSSLEPTTPGRASAGPTPGCRRGSPPRAGCHRPTGRRPRRRPDTAGPSRGPRARARDRPRSVARRIRLDPGVHVGRVRADPVRPTRSPAVPSGARRASGSPVSRRSHASSSTPMGFEHRPLQPAWRAPRHRRWNAASATEICSSSVRSACAAAERTSPRTGSPRAARPARASSRRSRSWRASKATASSGSRSRSSVELRVAGHWRRVRSPRAGRTRGRRARARSRARTAHRPLLCPRLRVHAELAREDPLSRAPPRAAGPSGRHRSRSGARGPGSPGRGPRPRGSGR